MTLHEYRVAAAFSAHAPTLPPGFTNCAGITSYAGVSICEFVAWHCDAAGFNDAEVAAKINWVRPGLERPVTAEDVGAVLALARRWGLVA